MGRQWTVWRGAWEFWLAEHPAGYWVSIPDCGGMADILPRDAAQLAWAEAAFAPLPALERIGATTWTMPPEALPELEALLR